jgi:hypothetical protein
MGMSLFSFSIVISYALVSKTRGELNGELDGELTAPFGSVFWYLDGVSATGRIYKENSV